MAHSWTRRDFIRFATLVGAGGLLAACGGTQAGPSAATASSPSPGSQAPASAASPASAAASAASPASAAASSAAPAAPSGVLTLVNGVDAESLDPYITTNAVSISEIKGMFDSLIALDDNLNPQPALATSWENPNDTTWRFHLRPNVKFHDGSTLDAASVKFTLDRAVDPATKNPQAATLKPITEVKVVDSSTVDVITGAAPFAALLNVLYLQPIMSPSAVKAAGDKVGQKPVGTGQYKFVEWVPGDHLTMEANPDYWGQKAKVQRLVWKVVPEASTRVVALKSGEADLISNVPPTLLGQLTAPLNVQKVPGTVITIMFNLDKKPFDNVKVRQALNYAVNVDEIIKSVLSGTGTRLASVTKQGMLGYDPALKPYAYDPAKAKQLLSEAGFPNGFEATLDSPNGRYLNDKLVAEAVAGQLAQVGVKATVNTPDFTNLVKLIVGHQSQFYLIGSVEPTSEITFPRAFEKGGAFYQGFADSKVTDLIDKANATLDRDQRNKLFQQADALVQQDAPWLFLYAQQDIYGLSARLAGFRRRPDPYLIVSDYAIRS